MLTSTAAATKFFYRDGHRDIFARSDGKGGMAALSGCLNIGVYIVLRNRSTICLGVDDPKVETHAL